MSTSRGTQQLYYGTHQQPPQRIPVAQPPLGMQMDPHHRQQHQVVVVSGTSGCATCVGDYHSPSHRCHCPSCESKIGVNVLPVGGHPSIDDHKLYTYPIHSDQTNQQQMDEDDGMVQEFTTDSGERHVLIMTKNDLVQEQDGISVQERIRRQKLSEAARNRYALLSDEERRAVTERRVIMRQRRKQKEREMEELEAILRATNDITDDLVPMDENSLQRKRAKISRYQSMTIEERRDYNQKRRLRQLGLPENIHDIAPGKLEQIKTHITEVNAKKAEAARQRYHRMSHEERKAYNRRRTESFRKRRLEEEKLLSTPAGQITPEALEKAQSIMLRNAKRAEQARLRYQKKQQEKGIVPRRQRKPKTETILAESMEPNLDQILDTIERDVVRKTEEARQALLRMQQTELKKEETDAILDRDRRHYISPTEGTSSLLQSPIISQSAQNTVQYVQVPAQTIQNGVIIADNKFVQLQTNSAHQPSHSYTMEIPNKYEGTVETGNFYTNPISIINHELPHQRQLSSLRSTHNQHNLQGQQARIEIVQPTIIASGQGNFEHVSSVPTSGSHIIHYTTQPHTTHQYATTIQFEQPLSHRHSLASSSRNISNPSLSSLDQKLLLQKAKRAERARRRYHEMSAEARHEFNAKRAQALKMARLRDEELCRLGDELNRKAEEPDEDLRMAIDQARMRRARRAEAARLKYQMTSEQRKAHNAMRDAQRRQRKRELEDTVVKQ